MTRRDFFKKMVLGTGLLFTGCENLFSVERGRERGRDRVLPIRSDNPAIRFNRSRCRRSCRGECIDFCSRTTGVHELPAPRGTDACVHCGQCTLFCQWGAITERFHYRDAARAISDSGKIVVATTAPAIRVALGEMYRLPPGTNVEGKIVGALKHLGVDYVLDATFAADLTVMEEASELLQRLESNGSQPLPMFTSCCPAWVRFVRLFYPHLLPNLSTVKSPLLMQGALVKTWFADKMGIDPARIVNVALTPCTAKKGEILLPGMNSSGFGRDVDIVLTTREIAYLFNNGRVNFTQMPDLPFSPLMGAGSGAGMIFGNTGGVMEAALRTAYRLFNGENPPAKFFDLRQLRGFDNVRQANIDFGKRKLSVAVVHGINKANSFIKALQNGAVKYDFVEVMGCGGGCIGGGGQPNTSNLDTAQLKQRRKNGLYQRDIGSAIRLSYDNPQIKAIYTKFLGQPLSAKAKKLLHINH